MTKFILSLSLLFIFTACDERVGRGMQVPVVETKSIHEEKETLLVIPTLGTVEDIAVMQEIPILEEEQPAPSMAHHTQRKEENLQESHRLDIAHIRVSHANNHTRVVLDTFADGAKSKAAGRYSYKKADSGLMLQLLGYSSVSALSYNHVKSYPQSKVLKSIALQKDPLALHFKLKDGAKVNIFELKEPGRIVIDIR